MNNNNKPIVAISTCPLSHAKPLAEALVKERLAACVNQLPGVISTYIWNGKLQTDAEVLLVIKTQESRWRELESRIKALHPYELPELIAIPLCAGSERYLDWIRQSTAPAIA